MLIPIARSAEYSDYEKIALQFYRTLIGVRSSEWTVIRNTDRVSDELLAQLICDIHHHSGFADQFSFTRDETGLVRVERHF